MSRHTRSLRASLLLALLGPVLAVSVAAGVAVAVEHLTPELGAATAHVGPATVPGEAELRAMLRAGDCWGSDRKPHPYPSRVWVRLPYGGSGDVRYVLRGQAAVDVALSSGDYSRVAAFCRAVS